MFYHQYRKVNEFMLMNLYIFVGNGTVTLGTEIILRISFQTALPDAMHLLRCEGLYARIKTHIYLLLKYSEPLITCQFIDQRRNADRKGLERSQWISQVHRKSFFIYLSKLKQNSLRSLWGHDLEVFYRGNSNSTLKVKNIRVNLHGWNGQ